MEIVLSYNEDRGEEAFLLPPAPYLLPLKSVGQNKVELLLFEVGMGHLHAYRVAKLIAVMPSAAYKTVVALVQVLVVIVQVAHGDTVLAVVPVYLTVYTGALYAADVRIEHLSQLVGHELHHLVFDAVALCVLRYLLHVRAVFAQLLVLLLVGGTPSRLIFCE